MISICIIDKYNAGYLDICKKTGYLGSFQMHPSQILSDVYETRDRNVYLPVLYAPSNRCMCIVCADSAVEFSGTNM